MKESTFKIIFSSLKDPRIDRTKLHNLLDIILLSICAVLCGAETWIDIAEFGQASQDWLKTFHQLPIASPLMTP